MAELGGEPQIARMVRPEYRRLSGKGKEWGGGDVVGKGGGGTQKYVLQKGQTNAESYRTIGGGSGWQLGTCRFGGSTEW